MECGYEVIIGGPQAENERSFPGCQRVVLGSAKEAAIYAFTSGVALIVSHTPPRSADPLLVHRSGLASARAISCSCRART